MKDRVHQDIGATAPLHDWAAINWQLAKKRVKNLRQRIYRVTKNRQWNQVRSLMKLMLRSYSNLLTSIRRVTQDNKGKRTAGVDGERALSPEARIALVRQMQTYTPWQVKPARRIYIPKANGKQRPLGIPIIKNRTAQAIMKNALEPSWEVRFETNSYGFRPGRSGHDAIEQCHNRLKKGMDTWILDADIRGAFDHISHRFIQDALGYTPGRALVKQWLKAGYVEADRFHPTDSGTPQGGVISPLLANIALDGLQALLASHTHVKAYSYTQADGRRRVGRTKYHRYGFIRYADDFLVTARSRQDLEAIIPSIEAWLAERGLELNKDKTTIGHIDDGVNFLGFHIRRFNGRCYTLPQKEKVHTFLQQIRQWLKRYISATQAAVIHTLNPLLRGWGNYYRHGVSKGMFRYVDDQLWKMLWRWACKRHRNKNKHWIAQKYFMPANGARWTFNATVPTRGGRTKSITLLRLSDMPIVRHIKVKGIASPDDPGLAAYWYARQTRYGRLYWGEGSKLGVIAERQHWRCTGCGTHLFEEESLQTHHKVPVAKGGTDRAENLEHLHTICHQQVHQMRKVQMLQDA